MIKCIKSLIANKTQYIFKNEDLQKVIHSIQTKELNLNKLFLF